MTFSTARPLALTRKGLELRTAALNPPRSCPSWLPGRSPCSLPRSRSGGQNGGGVARRALRNALSWRASAAGVTVAKARLYRSLLP